MEEPTGLASKTDLALKGSLALEARLAPTRDIVLKWDLACKQDAVRGSTQKMKGLQVLEAVVEPEALGCFQVGSDCVNRSHPDAAMSRQKVPVAGEVVEPGLLVPHLPVQCCRRWNKGVWCFPVCQACV